MVMESHELASNFSVEKKSTDIEGAWGSSTYDADSVNSTANLTTDQILELMLGPKQVKKSIKPGRPSSRGLQKALRV